jgi:hypothetical protein
MINDETVQRVLESIYEELKKESVEKLHIYTKHGFDITNVSNRRVTRTANGSATIVISINGGAKDEVII